MHVSALYGLGDTGCTTADCNLLVIVGALELFALAVNVDSKVGVVVDLVWTVRSITDTQDC